MPQTLQDYLEALRDVIIAHQSKSAQHEPTPTEYFALIASTLSSGAESVTETLPMLLKVLSAVLPSSQPHILRMQFKPVSHTLITIAQQYGMDREQPSVLASALTCLGKLLQAQETSEQFWTSAPALQALNALLAFVDDETEVVRRAVHEALVALLAQHARDTPSDKKGLRSYFADFCVGVFKAASRASYKRAFAVVVLLESALISLSEKDVSRVYDASTRLHLCEVPRLSAAVQRTLDALLQSPLYTQRCSAALSAHFVQSLLAATASSSSTSSSAGALGGHGPNRDVETQCFLHSALASALLVLLKQDADRARELWERVFAALSHGAESEYVQVHVAVSVAIKRCVTALFGNDTTERERQRETVREVVQWQRRERGAFPELKNVPLTAQNVPSAVKALSVTVVGLERLLAYKFSGAWLYLLDCVRALCESVRETDIATYVLSALVRRLGDIETAREREVFSLAHNAQVALALRDTLGAALHALSLADFLSLCPIASDGSEDNGSANGSTGGGKLVLREWVLDLLAYELKNMPGRLSDFYGSILPVLDKFLALAMLLAKHPGKEQVVALLRGKIVRLWALLPEMCHGRVLDVTTAFLRFKDVTSSLFAEPFLSELSEASFSVVMALGRVAKHVKNNGTPAERALCATESAHYVPLLLRYTESLRLGDGCFAETLGALSLWLSLAPETLVGAVARKLLQLVLTSTNELLGESAAALAMDATGAALLAKSERTAEAAVYMAVLHAMIPFLSPNLALVLYKTIRPLLSLDDALSLQKRAYSLLYTLLQHHRGVVLSDTSSSSSSSTTTQSAAERERESTAALLALLADSLLTTHVSARALRLKCISLVLSGESSSSANTASAALLSSEAVQAVLGEVLLCQRDSNKKTRDEAAQILKLLALRSSSSPTALCTRLCAALVGETTAMRAAAVQALTVLLAVHRDAQRERDNNADDDGESLMALSDNEDEENDSEAEGEGEKEDEEHTHSAALSSSPAEYAVTTEEYHALLAQLLSLLPSLSLLLSQQSSEQTKSVLTLLKLLVSAVPRDALSPSVPLILHAACTLTGALKPKMTILVRAIVRRLTKKFAIDELRPHLPATDMALLDYVAREKRKNERKRQRGSGADKRSVYDALLHDAEDESDEDDDRDGAGSVARSVRDRRAPTVRGGGGESDMEEEREDYRFQKRKLKATLAPRSVVDERERERERIQDGDDEDMQDERLSLSLSRHKRQRREQNARERGAPSALAQRAMSVQQQVREKASRAERGEEDERFQIVVDAAGKVSIRENASAAKPSQQFSPSVVSAMRRDRARETGSQAGSARGGAQKDKKRRPALREPGAEYRAKKAGGDVWKKGVTLQPHAYIPLDPRLLSKKNTSSAVEHFGVVVDSAKNNRRKVKALRRR